MKCYECIGHCNKKGYPSVMKGSAYCESQRGILKPIRAKLFTRLAETIMNFGWRLK